MSKFCWRQPKLITAASKLGLPRRTLAIPSIADEATVPKGRSGWVPTPLLRRVAVITGSSSGIGKGIALEMAHAGSDVCINYYSASPADDAAAEDVARQVREIGRRAIIYAADVSDRAALEGMFDEAEAQLGPVDVLVTNAITFVLMSVGGVGVLQSLQQKRTIRCACLGTALNLPMTKVTLVENGTMALMAAFMLAGCAGPPQSASYPLLGIENASSVQLTILSLNGDTYPSVYSTGTDASGEDRLHGWLVLQSCPLEQTAQSMRLLRSINADMAQGYKGIPVDCFQPRHAIRISTTDSLTEYLICYQCHNYQCWVDGSRVGSGGIADHSAEIFDRLLIKCSASSG